MSYCEMFEVVSSEQTTVLVDSYVDSKTLTFKP